MASSKPAASHGRPSVRFSNPESHSVGRRDADYRNAYELALLRSAAMYLPNFLDGFDRLVAFDAETTGKRTPDAEFVRKQPFAWRAPGIIIEVGFVEEGSARSGQGRRTCNHVSWVNLTRRNRQAESHGRPDRGDQPHPERHRSRRNRQAESHGRPDRGDQPHPERHRSRSNRQAENGV